MIEVYFTNLIIEEIEELVIKAGSDKDIKVKVAGHAGFDKKDGDIVCAAVSAIVQSAIIAVTKVAGIRQKVQQRNGFLESKIAISKLKTNDINNLIIILNTMLVGLQEIIKYHPEALKIFFEKE